MNLREIERVVGMIQSHIFKNSNAYSSGMLKSHFRGSGLHFREHQVYVPGDDVRFIDWKLSARSPNVYIKTFEEERNVEIVVFLDLSHSLLYGFEKISKLQASIEIIGLLYLLAAQTHDKIRVIIWSHKTINLPPSHGKSGLTLFIAVLEKMGLLNEEGQVVLKQPATLNNLSEQEKFAQMKIYLAKRKEVIYLGDLTLLNDVETWQKIINKKNMHCFRIYSPIDKNEGLPFLFKVKNPSDGRSKVFHLNSDNGMNPLLKKERFKEIGVHERYLEKFIRELV
jgi:hypothetical protein